MAYMIKDNLLNMPGMCTEKSINERVFFMYVVIYNCQQP